MYIILYNYLFILIYITYTIIIYNSTEYLSKNVQPSKIKYAKLLQIPVTLKSELEPKYIYDDYIYDLKQGLQ